MHSMQILKLPTETFVQINLKATDLTEFDYNWILETYLSRRNLFYGYTFFQKL